MNAAVWIRLMPNALLMFQSKYIKSMLFSSESTDKDDTSRGVSPKLYFVMLPPKRLGAFLYFPISILRRTDTFYDVVVFMVYEMYFYSLG